MHADNLCALAYFEESIIPVTEQALRISAI